MPVSEYWYIKAFKDGQLYLANLKPFEFEYSTVSNVCKFGDGSDVHVLFYVQDVYMYFTSHLQVQDQALQVVGIRRGFNKRLRASGCRGNVEAIKQRR